MPTAKLQWINAELLICEAELSELNECVWLGVSLERMKDWPIGSTLVFQLLDRLKRLTDRLIGYSQAEKTKIMTKYIDKLEFIRESPEERREWNVIKIQYTVTEGVVRIGNYDDVCQVVDFPWRGISYMLERQKPFIIINTVSALRSFLFKLFNSMTVNPWKQINPEETTRLADALVLTFFNSGMTSNVVNFRFSNFMGYMDLDWTAFQSFMATRAEWADYYEVDYNETRKDVKEILSKSSFECEKETYVWQFVNPPGIKPAYLQSKDGRVYYLVKYDDPPILPMTMAYCINTFDDLNTYILGILEVVLSGVMKKNYGMSKTELGTITRSMLLTHFDKMPA
jgi:hypothetical protein